MRALHVDAFFEFLLGKKHSYYIDIPPADDPYPSQGRDGVPAEEDLALRALDPSFKPKRGRKRNSSPAIEHRKTRRPPLITSFPDQRTQDRDQAPQTSHPGSSRQLMGANMTCLEGEPWTAVTPGNPLVSRGIAPQSATVPGHKTVQWQSEQTPSTPYPFSAIEGSRFALDDTMSAVTPSAKQFKRKHGPAVSSAWSGGRTIGGKLRGRPAAQRSTVDGAFSTFPAVSISDRSNTLDAVTPTVEITNVTPDPPVDTNAPSAADQNRARLRLQVPQYEGDPVRLMTPPTLDQRSTTETAIPRTTTIATDITVPAPRLQPSQIPQPLAHESLKRALSADLLRADIQDRTSRLSGLEAKALSTSILASLNITSSSPSHDLITAQTYLNLKDSTSLLSQGVTSSSSVKKIRIARFVVDEDGYTVPLEGTENADSGTIRQVYDISWTNTFGALNIEYSIRDLEIPAPGDDQAEQGAQELDSHAFRRLEVEGNAAIDALSSAQRPGAEEETDWKAQYELMAFRIRMMRGRFENAREKVLDTVLSL